MLDLTISFIRHIRKRGVLTPLKEIKTSVIILITKTNYNKNTVFLVIFQYFFM